MPTNKRTANTMYVLRWLHLRSRLAPQKSRSCARSGLYLFTLLVRLRREDSDAISQLTGHDAGASIYTVLHVMKILTAGTAERAQLYGQVYVQLPVAQWLHRKRNKNLRTGNRSIEIGEGDALSMHKLFRLPRRPRYILRSLCHDVITFRYKNSTY